ncbi:MAG: hypothetical protein KC620_14710 [Myxococcales bacterium]|nr:hypothetical protein [Myxococcales bacterium]
MTNEPLTDQERAQAREMLTARRRIALIFTSICGGALLLFALWASFKMTRTLRHDPLIGWSIIGATALVLVLMIWFFGWGLVRRLAADIAAGQKQRREGTLTRIDAVDNAYGETIYWVWLDGKRLLDRQGVCKALGARDTVTLFVLPRSGLILAAERR